MRNNHEESHNLCEKNPGITSHDEIFGGSFEETAGEFPKRLFFNKILEQILKKSHSKPLEEIMMIFLEESPQNCSIKEAILQENS